MSLEPVTLEQVKSYLRLEASNTSEDGHLALLITAARRAIENDTGRVVTGPLADVDGDDVEVVVHAMLLLIGHWYVNREAVGANAGAAEVPLAVRFLLDPLRVWVV